MKLTRKCFSYLACGIAAFALTACGGGSGSAATGGGSTETPVTGSSTGILTDAQIQGVAYKTSSGVTGTTGADGSYKFNPGDTVEFTIGGLSLGSVTATGIVTPLELAGGSAVKLQNLLVLVQSLDSDGNPDNGITIPAAAASAVTASVDLGAATATFASSANTALQAAMTAGGITTPIKTVAEASAHFLSQGLELLASNVWTFVDGTSLVTLRFSANGEYIIGEATPDDYEGWINCNEDGSGCEPAPGAEKISQAGVEYGTLTLPSFNEHGYSTSVVAGIDTNLQGGLSHPLVCDRIKTTGDQLVFGGCPDAAAVGKMDNDPASIVGAWAQAEPAVAATTLKVRTFYFFANGKFVVVDPLNSVKGVESGSYTWTNNQIVVTQFDYDNNGTAGMGNGNKVPRAESFSFVLDAGGATATFINTAANPTTYVMTRISK